MLRIAGAVIIYNPPKDVYDNILTYINQVDFLYIIDNSDNGESSISKINFDKSVKKVINEENIGIAAALNIAVSCAIEDGYNLLLTMDQDSRISEKYVSKMIYEFEINPNIGMLGPFIIHNKNPKVPENQSSEYVDVVMTSGSIINLIAYQKAGRFLDKLFIDYVDNEYCLRMKSSGYDIMKVNSVCLYHELGDVKHRKFFSKNIFPTNHSALRWYYRTRNRLYVYNTYKDQFPDYVKFDKKVFVKELIKILFYEKSKYLKFRMIFTGYLDFKRNKFGKFDFIKNSKIYKGSLN